MKYRKFYPCIVLMLILSFLHPGNLKAEGIKELANGTTHYPRTKFGWIDWAEEGANE